MNAALWIALLAGTAALIDDLVRRRISNWISAGALLGGLGFHCLAGAGRGFWFAAAGTLAGFAVFLVFYLLGGLGGGDVKLMAGFGTLLGAGQALVAAVLAALVGGAMALAALAVRRKKPSGLAAIPYSPAIVAGAWLAAVAQFGPR